MSRQQRGLEEKVTVGSVGLHLVVHAATRLKMMTKDTVPVTLVPHGGGVVDPLVRLSRTARMVVMEQRDLDLTRLRCSPAP
jgi:hypothetical protein